MTATSLLAASVALPLLTLASPANAAITVGTDITVFPNRDMVLALGYQFGETLRVEVLRNGAVIGITEGPANLSTPEGDGLEVNHGVATVRPGDCWQNYTPDIIGGDVIKVTALDRLGAPADTMTVANVDFSGGPVEEQDGSVSISGTAAPGTDFIVHFRRDKPDPKFRRDLSPVFDAATNTWKATFRPTATSPENLSAEQQRQIALTEADWLARANPLGPDMTQAELGEANGVAAGCPGSADPNTLVGGLSPINITSGDVTFSGTAKPGVQAVTVTVGALGSRDAVLITDPNGVNPGTWTLTVPKTDLETLQDGNVVVTPHFDTLAGTPRNVLKDMVAPLAPTPSIPPGTYSGTQSVALNKPSGEGTSKVYWEIGNETVPDPDEFSNPYTGQIQVTSTQTIKGRLIDVAGNPGAVGTFAYRIGNPPPAPTGLTGTESTTAAGTANLQWTAVAGATGYNVYRDTTKLNATPLTTTSYADTAAGLGQHSYVVRAVEANGIESLDSNLVTVTIAAPDVPTGLRATAGDSRVTLNWTAVTGAARYRVYRDGVAIATEPASNSFIDANRTNGTLYEYAITALDAGGNESGRTGVVQAVPQVPTDTTPPPAPTVTPATGTYTSSQSVTMADAEAGAVIRYTVGTGTTVPTDPTAADPEYAGAITVSASQVIKAAAFDAAGNRSPITQRNYTINAATGGTRTVTVNASADTTVRQELGTTNYGTATTLLADTQSVTGNAATRARSYLRFTIPALAAGESITGATLSLNVTNATGNGPALRRTATTWTETTMTWNSGQPALSSSTVVANYGAMATGRVATAVSGITGAGTVSFQLEPESSDGANFSSRETTAGPQLVLTITGGGTTTTPPPAGDTTAPPAPAVNPASGTYTSAQTVTATNTEAGVTHRYTLGNGTTVPADPTTTSTALPAGGLPVSASSVVKVAAFDAAGNRSPITQRNYTINAATGGTRTLTINASADTTVRQDTGTTTGGTATSLKVDSQSIEGNAATRARSYVRFTIPALAAGESITGATVSLNVTNGTTNGPALRRTATTWNESTMTWNSGQPALSSSTVVANFGNMATGRVATAVSGITGAGTVSFQLEAEVSDGLDFSSRETTADPQLVLTIATP